MMLRFEPDLDYQLQAIEAVCGSTPETGSKDDVAAPEPAAETMVTEAPTAPASPEDTSVPETAPAGTISRESVGEDWPLTVDSGVVACDGKNGMGSVTFTSDGTTYGVNGIALGQGLPAIDPIWADNPAVPGLKMNIGPIIDAGPVLCK